MMMGYFHLKTNQMKGEDDGKLQKNIGFQQKQELYMEFKCKPK